MNEETFNLGERVAMKVENIRLQPEFLLRPLDEDHVTELEESYAPNPNTHPAIIVQPFEDDYTVRAHAHTFQALVNIGQKRVNVRVVKGPEYEVLSYLGKEQALTKRLTPIEWGNYLLRFYNATPHKSLREMEKHFPFKKSRIQMLISGVQNKDVLNLMGNMQWSFDKAYESVQELDSKTEPEGSSVQQLDSKKDDKSPEELTESREAGDYEGHASEDSSVVHPIQTSGESVDDGEDPQEKLVDPEKASPDGEPGIEPTPSNAVTPSGYGTRDPPKEKEEVTPESSPSKWKHGYYHSACGTFLEDGTEHIVKKRNEHTCKDITTLLRRTDVLLSDFVETKLLPGEKTSDFLIRDAYGPHKLSDERLDEALVHAREVKKKAPIVLTALENLERFNGRMKVS